MNNIRKAALFLGPLLFLIFYNLPFTIINVEADAIIAVAIWMIIWWISETVSISITALIPLTIFPLINIMDIKTVAASYGSPIVFLFFGGFIMALALEKVNLHKRIAINIIKMTGTTPDRVILGFMIATAFLSMWISNTATTVVMLPIAISVIKMLIQDEDRFTSDDKNFALALMLCIAYSANVGGVATIIGTPPNTVLVGFLEQEYGLNISFFRWLMMGLPFSIIMIGIVYLVVVKWIYPNNLAPKDNTALVIQKEYNALGIISFPEKSVLFIFLLAILLWVFRSFINDWIPIISLTDSGISLLAAFLLMTVPFKWSQKKPFILEWEDTQKLLWGILILFGGGLALAGGLAKYGVIDYIGNWVSNLSINHFMIIGAALIVVILFMTELMSNVALVTIFCPVVAGIALGLDQELLLYLIPVTMASSCAFMLPMATPPNAIVFASGFIEVNQMVKVGAVLNVSSVLLLIIGMKYVIPLVF